MKKFLWIPIIFLSILFFSFPAQAAEEFSVTPLDPETGESQSNYFDLLVSPGEEKILKVRVNNPNEEEITVEASFNTSMTNDAGATIYTEENKDTSLKTDISRFSVLSDSKITIPANSAKEVSLTINVPEDPFEGELIGGFYFRTPDEEGSFSGLKSNYAYAIAVRLREADEFPAPSMKLNHVYIDQESLQNYIRINLQNEAAVLIKELNVKAEVYRKGEKDPVYAATSKQLRMAPNSNFNYGINLDTRHFKAGNYHCKVSGTANGQKFSLETDFVIEKEAARQLNETTIQETTEDHALWLLLGSMIGALLLFWLIFLFLYRHRKGQIYEKKTS
ncbi:MULTISPECIES: DUF916 and DUF3324 domain-containing protein [unclassified Enterococcus]|jgi:hypothetical protein|uniref:DUF916 and DUF3324 domain-containing protein n=1 Tax=unclassified Enterococcus TaxID=2608891 RepID=UPI003D2C67D7